MLVDLVVGGHVVVNSEPEIDSLMKAAGERLNIKRESSFPLFALFSRFLITSEHMVGLGGKKELLATPCDIEVPFCVIVQIFIAKVHRGYDGRVYVLDFARLFPPEAPTLSMVFFPSSLKC